MSFSWILALRSAENRRLRVSCLRARAVFEEASRARRYRAQVSSRDGMGSFGSSFWDENVLLGEGMLYKLCRRCRHGGGRRGSCHVAAEQLYSQSSLWASSASLQDWKIVTGSSDQSPTPRK